MTSKIHVLLNHLGNCDLEYRVRIYLNHRIVVTSRFFLVGCDVIYETNTVI